MPKFTKLDPKDVLVGREREAGQQRQLYVDALRAGEAGKIELERGDRPAVVKRRLQEASKEAGLKVRSSWEDSGQRALLWKKVGG